MRLLDFFLFCFCSDVFLVAFSCAARPWLSNFCLKSHQFVSSLFNVEILANLLSLRRFIADIRDAANEPCEPARSVIAWESSDEESSTHPHTPPLISTVTTWWILEKRRQHNYSHFWIQVFALTHGHKGRRSTGQPIYVPSSSGCCQRSPEVPLRRNIYLLFVSPWLQPWLKLSFLLGC